MRWYPRDALPHATRDSLVGVLELDRPIVELELHRDEGRLVGVWLTEDGMPIRNVVAARA